jgi:hypothetical protein
LQNALNRNRDFGLYFVRSSPVQTQTIIEDIKRDLPHKKIGILPLTDEVDNLFNLITALLTTVRDSRIPSLPCLPSLFCPRWIPKTLYQSSRLSRSQYFIYFWFRVIAITL